jgi:hypothetical protein
MSRTAGDRTVTLATPIKNTVPTLGKKCGRRERGADAQSRWERSHLPFAMFETVEGILVFGMAAPFAGRRRNAGLGRSATTRGVPPLSSGAPATAGCPKGAEEGNASQHTRSMIKAYAPWRKATKHRPCVQGDASFTRSFDPCTSIVTMLRRRKPS